MIPNKRSENVATLDGNEWLSDNCCWQVSPRRLSVELSGANNKAVHRTQPRPPPSITGRKLRPSESMESGLAMAGNNRGLAAHDLTKVTINLIN